MAGSASKDSYKKMLASSLKKLVSAAAKDEGTTAPAPPGAPKKGRKRATPATEDDDAEFKGVKKAKKVAKLRGKSKLSRIQCSAMRMADILSRGKEARR